MLWLQISHENMAQGVVEDVYPSLQKAAFLISNGVSLILHICPGGVPLLHGYGSNAVK